MKPSFERYCKDYQDIENYEKAKKDDFVGWDCHHRLETHNSDGERRLVDITVAELQALGMYYNRPASELIFLTTREHNAYGKGRKRSAEVRRKMAELHKGKQVGEKNPFYGKHHTDEARNKIGAANKGKNLGNTYAKGNKSTTGMHWYNNGKENKFCYECPPGFVPGRLRK